MIRLIDKYYWPLITVAIIIWILFTPSHFQKGGVHRDFYFAITAFVSIISFLITGKLMKNHWMERLLASAAFAFTALFFSALMLVPHIVEFIYADKTWFLWETKHRIFINFIFYGINLSIVLLLSKLYFKIRTRPLI